MGTELVIWIIVSCIMAVLAYLIHNKKVYGLLSGYNSYSDEEKAELERNGYMTYMGRLLWGMAILWMLSIPLVAFRVSYGLEAFLVLFFLYMIIGTLYGVKYDVKRKRKRNAFLLTSLYVIVIIGIGILFYQGEYQTEVAISSETVEMEGMYDDTISINEIESIEMVDDLPDNTIKTNGFATGTRSLGSFRSKEWGPGRHHVFTQYPPYIKIVTRDRYYLLNSKDKQETEVWYNKIKKAWSSQRQ
ncbi:MAG: DUF3784 domain-containing protein [Bacillus sp. (in: firmicutes)]